MNITSKYRSLSVQAKAALWFTICSFLQKGISFITVPIFTRLMSTEEYGTYTVYLSWLQILTIMTSLYLFNGVYDNAMAKYEKQRDEYTSAMQGLTLVITGAVFALYCFTSGFWEKILNLPKSMILLMFLEALLSPALSYWSGRQRFEYRYRILVCVTILQALMNPIASLVLIRMNGGTAMMRILGIVGVQICICVPIIVFQFCKGKEFFSKEYWGYALRIGIPIVPHYLSGIILNQGDRIMIDKMVGKTEVALYGLAYSIGMLVQLFISGMNSALTPWMYSKIKKGDIRSMRKVLQLLSVVVVGIAVALMLISPELVLIFGSPKYREAVYVIPPVAASVFFIFIYNILSMPQFYYEKTQFLMAASMAAAGANTGERIPRVWVTRSRKRRDTRYFGPYAKVWELRHSLDRLLRTFPVRTCTTNVFHKAQLTGRPCLFASIGKCSAPCVNRIEADEHRRLCEQLVGVMTGRLGRPYIAQLTRDMKEASAELEFEKAARLRDQIQMLETVVQQNAVVFDQDVDADVFGFASDELEASVHAFYVRAGSIRGERNWSVERVEDIDDADLMADLLVQVYSDAAGDNHPQSAATISTNREAIGSTQTITATDAVARAQATRERNTRQETTGRADLLAPIAPVPREIIVPVEPARREELEGWLTNLRGGAVTIRVASRGDKKQLMDRANENASQALQRSKMSRISDMGARTQAMNDVAKALGLAEAPLRIECYEIGRAHV